MSGTCTGSVYKRGSPYLLLVLGGHTGRGYPPTRVPREAYIPGYTPLPPTQGGINQAKPLLFPPQGVERCIYHPGYTSGCRKVCIYHPGYTSGCVTWCICHSGYTSGCVTVGICHPVYTSGLLTVVYATQGIPQVEKQWYMPPRVYLRVKREEYMPSRVYLRVRREGGMLRREVPLLLGERRHAAQSSPLFPFHCWSIIPTPSLIPVSLLG